MLLAVPDGQLDSLLQDEDETATVSFIDPESGAMALELGSYGAPEMGQPSVHADGHAASAVDWSRVD